MTTDKSHEQGQDEPPVPIALLNLCDECAEFSDVCAFYCEATIALFARSQDTNPGVLEGLSVISEQVKQRAHELHCKLEQVKVVLFDRSYEGYDKSS
jgi:hypothetical protein